MSPKYHVTVDTNGRDFPQCLDELAGFKIIKIELVRGEN